MQPLRAHGMLPAGDNSPATTLYQRHAHAVLLFLRNHLPVKEDAEDLLLDVLLAAVEKKTPLELPEGQQRAWLLHVARQKLIDHHRHVTRHPAVVLDDGIIESLFASEDHAPEQATLRREDHALLRKRFASLPEQYQRVLWLRFAYGLRSKEIGEQLQKSEGAVRMLLSRALNCLREIYESHQGDAHHDAE